MNRQPKSESKSAEPFENQGEGDKKSAQTYNADVQRFVKQGKVAHAAKIAAKAIDGRESQALKDAEEKGKARAKGEDPALKRP